MMENKGIVYQPLQDKFIFPSSSHASKKLTTQISGYILFQKYGTVVYSTIKKVMRKLTLALPFLIKKNKGN